MKKLVLLTFVLLLKSSFCFSKIILPQVLSDHMVLQQDTEVKIWGWTTNTSEKIEVWGSWNTDTVSTLADKGRWMVRLKTPAYGGPFTLHIRGHEKLQINDVYIGEVWLASGQSNMQMPLDSVSKGYRGVTHFRNELQKANYPKIRFFDVYRKMAETPQDDTPGVWIVCTPENARNFSAVAYFFAEQLHLNLEVPIGILHSSWGGTNAETWVRKDFIISDSILNTHKLQREGRARPTEPGLAFNAMIAPLQNYSIQGVIWYQGEANIENYQIYHPLMQKLINSWRNQWEIDFPFYFTQIAPFSYRKRTKPPYLREAQLQALDISLTGMAITNDVGEAGDIHPRNKRPVGERLAKLALSRTYNRTAVNDMGPVPDTVIFKKGKAYVSFKYASGGLTGRVNETSSIKLAGADRKFYPAQAQIKDSILIVQSEKVQEPVALRVGFDNLGEVKIINTEGIPASPFRTDDWPLIEVED
ncbi:sialate O-acetylesterase [Leeuwenhoekiella nanhaiensis]|uniref:Sialate O-acetylesterase domain-containing protein n=1 Tax=Leeuwenhoekiella nanhaiensis TaxID=1655491 RepID=A0A2G1VPW7_9FLAO|nr:sialate O-acetylesterase [Leeuwenhoekiella nanhaiensis]PHQ28811.1 hypothetical protein CJ305_13415 [Leeuwenhoekiella nanhaiensis]